MNMRYTYNIVTIIEDKRTRQRRRKSRPADRLTDEDVEAEGRACVVHAVDARGGVEHGGEVLGDEVQAPPICRPRGGQGVGCSGVIAWMEGRKGKGGGVDMV